MGAPSRGGVPFLLLTQTNTMEQVKSFISQLQAQVSLLMHGPKTNGEPINLKYGTPAPTRTLTPDQQLSENEWMKEFRVSSLHNVHQAVYLG